jgi:hypothetical protein
MARGQDLGHMGSTLAEQMDPEAAIVALGTMLSQWVGDGLIAEIA